MWPADRLLTAAWRHQGVAPVLQLIIPCQLQLRVMQVLLQGPVVLLLVEKLVCTFTFVAGLKQSRIQDWARGISHSL